MSRPAITQDQVASLTSALAGKAASSHNHPTSEVTGLDTALSGKASTAHQSTHAPGGSDALPWTTIHGRGTTAARPAAAAANAGYLYFDTTLNQWQRSTGSAWEACEPSDVPTTRTISTTAPLTGGGDLSANRTLAVSTATTSAAGVVQLATDGGTTAGQAVQANDSRLSNARTPSSHTHGNITNAGAIGSTANLPVRTGASGVLEAGSFGTTAATFCEGNDSRLSNARTPTTHATSHQSGGADQLTLAQSQITNLTADLAAKAAAAPAVAAGSSTLTFTDAPQRLTLTLSGNTTFTGSGYADKRTITLFITCDSVERTLSFPSGWVFAGAKPTSLGASKLAVFTLECIGAAEADVRCAWAAQA